VRARIALILGIAPSALAAAASADPLAQTVQLETRRSSVHGGLLLGRAIRKLEMTATVGNLSLKFTPSLDWRSTLDATLSRFHGAG
jgi:hypothetical protein